MATQTEIANMAAISIGTESRVLSLDDDTFLARTLKEAWNIQRQAAIRDGHWNFAMRRAALPSVSTLTEADLYPWQYGFQLPAQSLQLVEVLDCLSNDEYDLDGKIILANQSGPLRIRYAVDVPEVAEWDPSAAEAFAERLAWKCGRRIAGSAFDREAAKAKYDEALMTSKRAKSLEKPPIEQQESDWVTARFGYGSQRRRPGFGIV